MTLAEVGKMKGLTRERIRQLESQALERLFQRQELWDAVVDDPFMVANEFTPQKESKAAEVISESKFLAPDGLKKQTEQAVALAIAEHGSRNKTEIGRKLGISHSSLREHLKTIRDFYGLPGAPIEKLAEVIVLRPKESEAEAA